MADAAVLEGALLGEGVTCAVDAREADLSRTVLNGARMCNAVLDGADLGGAQMRHAPIEDRLFGTTTLRVDGRAVHDMFRYKVKTPAESHARWDYYTLLTTIPGAEAFRPLKDGGCKLVR